MGAKNRKHTKQCDELGRGVSCYCEDRVPQHSPLPWKVHDLLNHGEVLLQFGKRSLQMPKEDAAFIIKAVSNYDQMLAALKRIADPLGFELQSQGDVQRRMAHAKEAVDLAERED